MRPYPGKEGKAEYCGRGAHFYQVALKKGEGQRCKDCGHVLGKPVKRRSKSAKQMALSSAA